MNVEKENSGCRLLVLTKSKTNHCPQVSQTCCSGKQMHVYERPY